MGAIGCCVCSQRLMSVVNEHPTQLAAAYVEHEQVGAIYGLPSYYVEHIGIEYSLEVSSQSQRSRHYVAVDSNADEKAE